MSLFMIETDAVTSAKASMDSIASQITSIASSVNGYDTSCEDGFDFGGAKSVIAGNIEAFSTKVKNTGAVMESVVSSHTALQGSMKFSGGGTEKTGDPAGTTTDPAGTTTGDTTGGTTTGGTTTGGTTTGGYTGGYTGGGYTGGGYTPISSETPGTTDAQDGVTTVTETIAKIEHEKVDKDKLSADAKKIFDSVTYNELGYAMYAGMFVIACSTAVGKVGDIIEFTLNDGNKVRCIVGQNLATTGAIHFFIDDKWKEDAEGNVSKDFASKISKISNYGQSAGSNGTVDTSNLPAVGQNTSKWDTLGDSWTIVTTKADVPGYSSYVKGKISQNADSSRFGDKCLSFAETHAYALYTGKTNDSAESASNYPHGGAFTSWYSDSKEETLKKVYSEIVSGRPVVIQVNGNKAGTSRHFVTVVGFRNSISDPNALTEDDLLIIDSWDGQLERMDQENSRFLTTGAQCHKTYSGYYLRVLKA